MKLTVQEKIDYILSMQNNISDSCSSDKALFNRINAFKEEKDYLNKLKDELFSEYTKGSSTGTVKFLQMTIVHMLLSGKEINANTIDVIKDSYTNDKEFFNKYFKEDKYKNIMQDMLNYSKKDPFKQWGNYGNILRRLLYCKKDFNMVNQYLKDIKDDLQKSCGFEVSSYKINTDGFLGNQGYGRNVPVIVVYNNQFNKQDEAIQICLHFNENKINTYIQSGANDEYSIKIAISSTNQYNKLISDINNSKNQFIDETNQRLNSKFLNKDSMNISINQILYGPPGTGKTYNTIIEAMKIITFEDLFKDWYLNIYCSENKVNSKEKTLNDYLKHINKINKEYLQNDNIFKYYENEKFLKLKTRILNSGYIKKDNTRNNKNSYYQHSIKRYEEFTKWLDYKKIQERFNEYKKSGQIEFVTFHQSYSYEEFVEGIKPDCKNNNLKYMLQDGIFKKICKSAQELKELKTQYNFNFDNISAYKILIPDSELFDYCIENNCVAINWGKDIDVSECNSEQEIENKIPTTYESRKQCISQLKIFKLWIDEDLKNGKDVIVIIPGSLNTIKGIAKINGEYTYNEEVENGQQQRSVEWIRKNINISSENIYNAKFVSPTITGMYNEKINKENFLKLINNTNVLNAKNAVLIIDEINRGNISKIFGELITLIEEDKRENLTVTLPYSHESFTVPKNLYIVGTMNTSDRSIASIDIALRRRFKFVEMMPNSELLKPYRIDDINLQELLDNLNEKISYLLDRDHQIGHSYFMNWGNYDLKTLKDVWFNSIMPLLNEYFYLDWDKLQAILGEAKNTGSFIVKKTKPKLMCSIDCTDDDCYYHFSKKEDINNETFKDLLIKLVKPESENNV